MAVRNVASPYAGSSRPAWPLSQYAPGTVHDYSNRTYLAMVTVIA